MGHIVILPWVDFWYLHVIWIIPLGLINQVRRPRLIYDYMWSGLNVVVLRQDPTEVIHFSQTLTQLLCTILHTEPWVGPIFMSKLIHLAHTRRSGSIQRTSRGYILSSLRIHWNTTPSSTSTYLCQWVMWIVPHNFNARLRWWQTYPIWSSPPLPTPPCTRYRHSQTLLRILMTMPTPKIFPPNWKRPSLRASNLSVLSPSSATLMFMLMISSLYLREDL